MTYRPQSPWQAEEPNRPKRRLVDRIFDGEVSQGDWRFMAIAILQLCDDLKVLEKEVADLKKQVIHRDNYSPDNENSAIIGTGRALLTQPPDPDRNRDLIRRSQDG
jgi:hypothetical protein